MGKPRAGALLGIEAVMPDGSVVQHLSGLLKDNIGYDIAELLCGSEGTLGIITAVRLRLRRPPGRPSVALVACDAAEHARLWEYRERQSEAFSSLGIVHTLDVSVPLASLPASSIRAGRRRRLRRCGRSSTRSTRWGS